MLTKPQINRSGYLTAAIVVALSLGWLAACVHVGMTWQGATANQEDNIALMTAGPHEGRWQTHDLVVDYSYTVNKNILDIEGTIDVAYHIERGFTSLSKFWVYMNLIDDSKLILDSRLIALAGGGTPIRTFRYKEQFELVDGTSAINFSYNGVATEGGSVRASSDGDGGSSYSFWKNP